MPIPNLQQMPVAGQLRAWDNEHMSDLVKPAAGMNANRDLAPAPAGPDLPAVADDGTDLTLIRWMLSLSPRERLEVAQQYAETIARLRDANSQV